ncbi:MAG: DUF2478 domain-containing protein [Pseudomonadota bacterium]|jgi:hypothetical protein
MFDSHSDVAAVVYGDGDDPDAVLRGFALRLRSGGDRPVGLIQAGRRGAGRDDLRGVLLPSGRRVGMWTARVGPHGGRFDVAAFADAQMEIMAALDAGADVLILNRFGRQETAGGGLRELVIRAAQRDVPVVGAVAAWRFADWLRFVEGMSVKLPCEQGAVDLWWRGTRRSGDGRAPASPGRRGWPL